MKKAVRIAVLFLALAVVFAMVFSVAFIASRSHHHCIGENCPVCLQIAACEKTVKALSLCMAVLTALPVCRGTVCALRDRIAVSRGNITLTALKVKLSD